MTHLPRLARGRGAALSPALLIFYYESRTPGGKRLRLNGLPEGDPESVEVTNNELTHAVESVIETFHDLNPVLEAPVQVIDIVGQYAQINRATVLRARFPARVEHDLAVSEGQLRPVDSPSSSFCRT